MDATKGRIRDARRKVKRCREVAVEMGKVSEAYEAPTYMPAEHEAKTHQVVDVTFQMSKAQLDWIQKLLEKNPWMGDLDTFLDRAVRDLQERYYPFR